jgi:GPI-anchor transamidase subunit K
MRAVLLVIATAARATLGDVPRSRQEHHRDGEPRVSTHTSNHAVIVSSSRYWFNYRHVINALSIYRLIRSNGIPDSNIVLMLADEYAVNPRNPLPNQLLPAGRAGPTLYDAGVEIDYRGDDVRVESFLRVLTGRRHPSCADEDDVVDKDDCLGGQGPVLDTDRNSNVLIYLTGHGGDNFFKFQDAEEVLASQLGSALSEMSARGMYRHVLLLADTCQAFTLGDAVTAPNVTVIGSSLRGESSYAHHSDDALGLSVIERYTHALIEFLNGRASSWQQLTLQQGLVDPYSYETQRAHVGVKEDTAVLTMNQLRMGDFFCNVGSGELDSTTALIPDDEPVLFSPFPPSSYEMQPPASLKSEPQCRLIDQRLDDRRGATDSVPWFVTLGRKVLSLLLQPSLEPADSLFVAMVVVLLGSVVLSSSAHVAP